MNQKNDRAQVDDQESTYQKGDILATNTVIVEIFNPAGQRMRIHTVTQRFKELLSAFYKIMPDE